MILPCLLDPCSSPGQTAKTILQVSGRAGVDLSIDVVAVNECKASARGLGMEWREAPEVQENPQNESGYDQQSLFHFLSP